MLLVLNEPYLKFAIKLYCTADSTRYNYAQARTANTGQPAARFSNLYFAALSMDVTLPIGELYLEL